MQRTRCRLVIGRRRGHDDAREPSDRVRMDGAANQHSRPLVGGGDTAAFHLLSQAARMPPDNYGFRTQDKKYGTLFCRLEGNCCPVAQNKYCRQSCSCAIAWNKSPGVLHPYVLKFMGAVDIINLRMMRTGFQEAALVRQKHQIIGGSFQEGLAVSTVININCKELKS